MSEPILSCPKCGAPGVSEDYLFVGCSDIDCTLPEMMMQDWSRLSRAAALLRAVEGLEAAIKTRFATEASGSLLLDDVFIKEDLEWGEVQYGPLEEAIVALAGEVAK